MNSIDLIRQYVDTGLELPNYQIKKLTPNLLKTYLRKRLVAVDANDYKWLSNFEIDLLDKDSQLIYFSKITPIQLNAYLKSSKTTTYESFLERWDKVVDFISFQLNDSDYLHAVAAALEHATSSKETYYDEFVAKILMPYIEDYLESSDKIRPIIFSRLINEHPSSSPDNLIKILLSNCPYIDNVTLDRIERGLGRDLNILVDAIKYKYIPSFIRANINHPNIKNLIWGMLSKVPGSKVMEVMDELYKYIPESNQDLRDYLSQIII
jgi:hypothetical protein